MEAFNDNGTVAIRRNDFDEFGEPKTVVHRLEISEAVNLREKLDSVLWEIYHASLPANIECSRHQPDDTENQ